MADEQTYRKQYAAEEDFFDDSIEEIAREFDVPHVTASGWEQNIGGVEFLTEKLGKNAPEGYLDLIRRREWIPHIREERVAEWIHPLKRWCGKNAEGVHVVRQSEVADFRDEQQVRSWESKSLGPEWIGIVPMERPDTDENDGAGRWWRRTLGPRTDEMAALRDELERKEARVKYELCCRDPEWIDLTRELRRVTQQLIEIYQCHLETTAADYRYKKDEIIELKEAFPYLLDNPDLVAETVDSTVSYVREFQPIPGEGVAKRLVKGKLRDEVLQRDGHACVGCGETEDLTVHHIVPRNQGGQNDQDNLATLCEECHYYAHGGGRSIGDGRYSAASWDSVEYDDREQFWDEWIQQDFEDRATGSQSVRPRRTSVPRPR